MTLNDRLAPGVGDVRGGNDESEQTRLQPA